MPLSWNEIKDRALAFSKEWEHETSEHAEGDGYMNSSVKTTLSEENQIILDALKTAVANALEKKRRLGQYAVVWKNGKPVRIGADTTGVDHER